MKIDIEGYGLRVFSDFIRYASDYPKVMASAMWYVEDTFSCGARSLKKAYEKALKEERNAGYFDCDNSRR